MLSIQDLAHGGADYFRAWLLYTYGGIYLDTDILLFNSLDSLLQENFFISNFTSDQQGYYLEPSALGGIATTPFLKHVLDLYNSNFLYENELTAAPSIYTQAFLQIYQEKEALKTTKIALWGCV